MTEILETERLQLRATSDEDSLFLVKLMNTPKWHEFIGDRGINTPEAALKYINSSVLPLWDKGGLSTFTVLNKISREKMGTVGFYKRDELEFFDLGFAFLPQFEGEGYALEASKAVLEYAQINHQVHTLHAITLKENERSILLLEKLGFRFERVVELTDKEALNLYTWTT